MDDDIKAFLEFDRLYEGIYLGGGLHPALAQHWNLRIYFVVNYSTRRAWVFGNFFCVEEVSLHYILSNFHKTELHGYDKQKVFYDVRLLQKKRRGIKNAKQSKSR